MPASEPDCPRISTMIPNHSHLIEGMAAVKAGVAECFRRLKWNELVSRGDFVMDEHQDFEPWEGPSGFRADSFIKPIYRRRKHRLDESRQSM